VLIFLRAKADAIKKMATRPFHHEVKKAEAPSEYDDQFQREYHPEFFAYCHRIYLVSAMRDRSCTSVHLAILFAARHNASMKRPGRKPKVLDPNQLAAAVLEIVTGEPVGPAPKEETGPAKDPASVTGSARIGCNTPRTGRP
jgi:hypothetical protein